MEVTFCSEYVDLTLSDITTSAHFRCHISSNFLHTIMTTRTWFVAHRTSFCQLVQQFSSRAVCNWICFLDDWCEICLLLVCGFSHHSHVREHFLIILKTSFNVVFKPKTKELISVSDFSETLYLQWWIQHRHKQCYLRTEAFMYCLHDVHRYDHVRLSVCLPACVKSRVAGRISTKVNMNVMPLCEIFRFSWQRVWGWLSSNFDFMMEAVITSESLVTFYQTTQCNIPEDEHCRYATGF
jgi:hypothetical protein